MKLHQILFFLLSIALVLGAIAFVLPEKGMELGAFKLKFLPAESIVYQQKVVKKDISALVANVDTVIQVEPKKIKHSNQSDGALGGPTKINYEINNATSVYQNSGSLQLIHQFFQKLRNASGEKKKIRIVHFGDSQIEGDRMTGFLRQRIQEQFGGYGPGLIPANNVYPTLLFKQSFSNNFVRYTCFGGPKLSNKKYGLFNSAARFTSEILDTTQIEPAEGWIEIRPGNGAFGRAKTYNTVKLFYNSCTVPCALKVYQGDQLIHEEDLITDGGSHTLKLTFGSTPSSLRYVFRSKLSPNINGFSMEGDYGVQVDNIGMRGSSGTFFGAINQTSFSSMLNEQNVEMVIMQFGGNSMPALKDSAGVRNYARYFKGQLQTLRRLKPNVAIVVIGPSDMSKLINGEYQTYPLLPYCVEQMKKESLSVNAGYWDLFEAMGGSNSMPAWVEKNLGQPDHIHFSIKGASIAAQLFYDAFMSDYLKWNQN